NFFDILTGESLVRKYALGRGLLETESTIKHGLLVFDSYHAFRVMRRQLFLMHDISYNKGKSLAEYDSETIQRLVKAGEINSKDAAWIEKRRPDYELGLRNGLNVARLAEQLTGHLLQSDLMVGGKNLNFLQHFNKWVFQKVTRGAMIESYLYELERARKNHTDWTEDQRAGYAAKQVNVLMGNLQRQGIIKSETFRDLGQIAFLAPQWVESMAQLEVRGAKQLAQVPLDAVAKRRIQIGTSGKAVGTGILAFIVANQIVNMATRGKPTWENPEPGRKFDAFIPDVDATLNKTLGTKFEGGEGFWLSPLSDIAEMTHSYVMYGHRGNGILESSGKILENKLSPLGRAEEVMRTGRDYAGRRLDDRLTEAGKAMIPTPLPFAGAFSETPGQGQRQAYSTFGLKVDPASRSEMMTDKTLTERIDRTQKDKAERVPTYEGKAHAMEESGYQQQERAKRVVGGLEKKDRNWIESRNLLIPGIASTVRLGKNTVPLSNQELEKLEKYSREEVVKVVDSFREITDEFDSMTTTERQESFNRAISPALKRARGRVIEEIPIGDSSSDSNAQKVGKTRKRRYHVFGQ
ncbi:MAG: hypothetical protein DMF62_12790, partial [Acidobacteria bacterium]